jgi:hypothetical protein
VQQQFWQNSARGNDEALEVLTVLRVFSDGECGPLLTGIWADACIKKNEAHDIVSDHFLRITDGTFFQVTTTFRGFFSLRKRIAAFSPSPSSYPGHSR